MAEGDVCRCSEELSKLLSSIGSAIALVAHESWWSAKGALSEISEKLEAFEKCLGTRLGLESILKKVEEEIEKERWFPAVAGLWTLLSELPLKLCKKR